MRKLLTAIEVVAAFGLAALIISEISRKIAGANIRCEVAGIPCELAEVIVLGVLFLCFYVVLIIYNYVRR